MFIVLYHYLYYKVNVIIVCTEFFSFNLSVPVIHWLLFQGITRFEQNEVFT